ncbi:MAG: hypothetical protein WDW38_010262 [Sanguina aurantia]
MGSGRLNTCGFLVQLAPTSPSLESYVCSDLARSAIISTTLTCRPRSSLRGEGLALGPVLTFDRPQYPSDTAPSPDAQQHSQRACRQPVTSHHRWQGGCGGAGGGCVAGAPCHLRHAHPSGSTWRRASPCPHSPSDVATVTSQAEVVNVLRSIFMSHLPSSRQLQELLLSLPHVDAKVLAGFRTALSSAHSEKDQRAVVKQLLGVVGGESTRQLLNSSIKGAGPAGVSEPKRNLPAKPSAEDSAANDAIGVYISNSLFS